MAQHCFLITELKGIFMSVHCRSSSDPSQPKWYRYYSRLSPLFFHAYSLTHTDVGFHSAPLSPALLHISGESGASTPACCPWNVIPAVTVKQHVCTVVQGKFSSFTPLRELVLSSICSTRQTVFHCYLGEQSLVDSSFKIYSTNSKMKKIYEALLSNRTQGVTE